VVTRAPRGADEAGRDDWLRPPLERDSQDSYPPLYVVTDILQPTHLLFVLVIALLVLGPKRLPEVARTLGNGLRDFRAAISGESNDDEKIRPGHFPVDEEAPREPPVQVGAGTESAPADAAVVPVPQHRVDDGLSSVEDQPVKEPAAASSAAEPATEPPPPAPPETTEHDEATAPTKVHPAAAPQPDRAPPA
jgi:TatA/E family protein of Tat protein translocase